MDTVRLYCVADVWILSDCIHCVTDVWILSDCIRCVTDVWILADCIHYVADVSNNLLIKVTYHVIDIAGAPKCGYCLTVLCCRCVDSG